MDNMEKYRKELDKITDFVEEEKTKEITLKERQRKLKVDKEELAEKAKELGITLETGEEILEELEIEIQQKLSIANKLIEDSKWSQI